MKRRACNPSIRKNKSRKPTGKMKRDKNGEVIQHKARLAAHGFSQRYGTDYDEVFALVVRQTTFRILMSVTAKKRMVIKQYDVKTAFLYGNLEEDIFMRQPPGYAVAGIPSKV